MKGSGFRRSALGPGSSKCPLPSAKCLILVVASMFCVKAPLIAHDIPPDVLVNVFVKPEGQRLHVALRFPLGAVRDIVFPTHGQGFLNQPVPESLIRDAARLWIANDLRFFEGDAPLAPPAIVATKISLPSDRSFASYDEAVAHITGPSLAADIELVWNQAMLDVFFEYPIASDRARFSIHPQLARLGIRVTTVLRFLPPGSATRAFEFTGDPGLVRLDPRWHQAAGRFVALGFAHILDGVDHLLFLFCLIIPFRRPKQLILIVTSFTVAHSITLIGSAFGLAPDALWFPPLVETLIAASIVYMALENIVGVKSVQRRWAITFLFGLVHGFGFSFALRQTLQFAGSHLLSSLFAFNVGIELGQLLVLALFVPALQLVFRFAMAERIGSIILSAIAAHTAWHWMTDRWAQLRQFPGLLGDPAFLVIVLRGLILVVALGGVRWAIQSRKRLRESLLQSPNSDATEGRARVP
jgi:HupE/UreJ protein